MTQGDKATSGVSGQIISLQVGRPQTWVAAAATTATDQRGAAWQSGIVKQSVPGKVWVGRGGLAGDGQSDMVHHGGPDNVVLAYDAGHYPVWREELALAELAYGSFGENFTVEGFSDETVCVGDVWRVGAGPEGLVLQVTQPRQPCWKLARRLNRTEVVGKVKERGWGGWYLRVLREGYAWAGATIERIERPHWEWPVARAAATMYGRKKTPEPARTLAQLPELSARWKRELEE